MCIIGNVVSIFGSILLKICVVESTRTNTRTKIEQIFYKSIDNLIFVVYYIFSLNEQRFVEGENYGTR